MAGQPAGLPAAEYLQTDVADPSRQRVSSYTQINHKIYYRAEDVRSFLAVLEARRKHEQKRRNGV